MKKSLLLSFVIFIVLFFPQNIFAQNQNPIVEDMTGYPGNNTVSFTVVLNEETEMPTVVTVKYATEQLPSPLELLDSVFTITSLIFNFTLDGLNAGNYYCTSLSFQNATGQPLPYQYCFWTTESSVGVQENDFMELKIYPNPADDKLFVQSEIDSKISVADILGKTFFHVQSKKDIERIEIDTLPAGAYFVTIENIHGKTTKKILIQ